MSDAPSPSNGFPAEITLTFEQAWKILKALDEAEQYLHDGDQFVTLALLWDSLHILIDKLF